MKKTFESVTTDRPKRVFRRCLDRAANRLGGSLLVCFLIVLCRIGVSQAMFPNPRDVKSPPQGRTGSRPCSRIGTRFLDPERLGPHGYSLAWSERNGIVYTCKAGFLDIAHVRGAIDRTAFLATKIFHKLQRHETEFSFKLAEPSLYFVQLIPPEHWNDLSQKERGHFTRHFHQAWAILRLHGVCLA